MSWDCREDHSSTSLVLSATTGEIVAQQRYLPFGGVRWRTHTPLPTDRQYTGQRWDEALGLYDYKARYYDPALGRFIQPDTVVPEPGDPQSLNRYAYARNNPLRYNDPTGHCWGAFSFIRQLPGYSTTCNNLDMAVTILKSDQASPSQKAAAGAYVAAEGGAHLMLAAGAVMLAGEGAGALLSGTSAAGASATAEAAATAACADGDCTNEVRVITQVGQNVWELSPLQRGIEVEKILGRSKFLSQNFPVIDRFEDGVATSIKSLDLNAPTYQNTTRLASTVMRYTRTLAQWEGQAEPWGRVQIHPAEIQAKVLELAVPPGGSPAQWETLFRVRHIAAETGVRLDLVIIR